VQKRKKGICLLETFPLLKNCNDINFIGSIEAREIPNGGADVIVSEAFVGNVILKLYEGLGTALIKKIKSGLMSTTKSKIGALLCKPALKETLKDFDASRYGGAPLLGCKGLVVKSHGNSKSNEIRNSILQCVTFTNQQINEKIKNNLNMNEQ
jgi:glycerol-3-phosphate acyltransferase PlsX